MTKASGVINGFTRYLQETGILEKPHAPDKAQDLPEIYEQYLIFYQKIHQIQKARKQGIEKVLKDFHRWCTNHHIRIDAMELGTSSGLRTHAMTRLAYTTGLRPSEIARIRLDDICFEHAQLTVPERKGLNPIQFPVPEATIKAMAAYIIGARTKNKQRHLFLSLSSPYVPITGAVVSDSITKIMQKAGVPGTAYWLRHTYAQNLLQSGASIFEIKEMLGHDCIKATKRYLHIHIKLMREVLFGD